MAIKIISRGLLSSPIYHGQCIYCKCTFEFGHKDAIEFMDDQREGQHYQLKCPQCGRIIWVKKELLRYE